MKKKIPNILTIGRIVLVPFFLFCLVQDAGIYKLIALGVFFISSITDFLDGYFARKFSAESELGRTLDPLADKILIISTLSAFIYLDKQIPLWMILAIVARDILITLIRILGEKRNIRIKTSRLAKAKTAFQMISIFIILSIFSVRSYRQDIQDTFEESMQNGQTHTQIALKSFMEAITLLPSQNTKNKVIKKKFAESVPYFLMSLVTMLTLISGIRYVVTNYKVFLK